MADGNEMLAPFGLRLVPTPADVAGDGQYILHRDQHFTAVVAHGDRVVLWNNNQTTDSRHDRGV
jgi:c-di-GMP-binding flagellar brake protein YcgR